MSWTPFAIVGARAWLLPVIALALAVYFAADELLVRRASLPRRLALALGNRLIAVAVILLSIPLLGAPGFLVLLLPLMGPLPGHETFIKPNVKSTNWPDPFGTPLQHQYKFNLIWKLPKTLRTL